MSKPIVAAVAASLAFSAPSAFADPSVPAPSTYVPAEPDPAAPAPVVQPAPLADQVDVGRTQFSGKRLAAEIAGGELISLLVSYAVFDGLCNGSDCMGSAIAAFGADFAVTPLAIWAGGRLMGGQGTIGMTYLGATTSLAAFSVQGSPDETPADALSRVNIEMTVSALLMPATSALLFELSSQMWFRTHHASLAVEPLRGHANGAIGGLTVAF